MTGKDIPITITLPKESPLYVTTNVGTETFFWMKEKGIWWCTGKNGPLYGTTCKMVANHNEAHLLETIVLSQALPKSDNQ